jgi:murein DD-endopeptidase MepM/ murein hydrolase activator NlpD
MERETVATRGDIEAVRADLAGINAQLAQLRIEVSGNFGVLHQRNRKADDRQRQTQSQINLQGAFNGLAIDAASMGIMLGLLLLSQAYVNAIDSMPQWMKNLIPGGQLLEQAEPLPESKQVFAFSSPADNLKKGNVVEGFEVTSEMGWRYVFGAKDWHEGYDLATPVGTPLHAVLPVDVTCLSEAQSGGGGIAAIYQVGTEKHKWLHLESCTPGFHETGAVFGTTGNTGRSTGPHLDYRVEDVNAGYVKPYANVLRLTLNPNAEIPTFNHDFGSTDASTLTDEEILCAIGRSEGTRHTDCQPNSAYYGHTDPGNGVWNLGTFSYQHGASTPEEADKIWLGNLRTQEKIYQDQAVAKFGEPLSKEALIAVLDGHTQSPAAAADFVGHLPSAKPNKDQIIEARSQSFIGPNGLNAPGLGNSMERVKADQTRRVDALMEQLNK